MRWTHLMTTAMLLSVSAPLAVASELQPCAPSATTPDAAFSLSGSDYYVRHVEGGAPRAELWRESNGVPGFQPSSAMACGAAADTLELSQCLSRYCLVSL